MLGGVFPPGRLGQHCLPQYAPEPAGLGEELKLLAQTFHESI
jgi:hypothetical protein